ncbi:hypothetical protein IV454_19370 [Massilia antarctica]|uniref:Iron transporter n=1 Tax=Massilia antarctica TaxID=2765360 RepID=A0AA48W9A9_9BURK|nr:hypothetical protein [Massilia antarctica]QPI47736.1 hypothetical protein IV454_19370 [Massilia antarctica]
MAKDSAQRERVLLHNGVVALILGYPLAIALSGVLHRLMQSLDAGPVAGQLTMWVVYPLWVSVIALIFLLPSKRACWTWLALANALAAGACYLLTLAGGGAA